MLDYLAGRIHNQLSRCKRALLSRPQQALPQMREGWSRRLEQQQSPVQTQCMLQVVDGYMQCIKHAKLTTHDLCCVAYVFSSNCCKSSEGPQSHPANNNGEAHPARAFSYTDATLIARLHGLLQLPFCFFLSGVLTSSTTPTAKTIQHHRFNLWVQ